MTALAVVLLCGAVFRLSWLIAADKVAEPFRDWVARATGDDSAWTYLVSCLWCTSMWITVPMSGLSWLILGGPLWTWILAALTASLVTGAVGSPLYKWLNPEPPLTVEELAAEIHEAARAQGVPGMVWMDTAPEYRAAMMRAVVDMRARKVVE